MKAIPRTWVKRIVDAGFPATVLLGNHVWRREDQPSTSWHYVTDDGWKIRVSDHWTAVQCFTPDAPMKVRSVGRRKIPLVQTSRACYKGFAGGIGRSER